jgi:hypothetical protein
MMTPLEAPSLLKLQISDAHMALVIQSGIKDEMPSFAKKYNAQDTVAMVAYLKTPHIRGRRRRLFRGRTRRRLK